MGDKSSLSRNRELMRKAGLPRYVTDMSKEELAATIKKKKECNDKAQHIVEKMLDCNVDEEWFLANLIYIDGGHFQDIIEERVIIKLCGYPLCSQVLSNVPSKKYHISTKFNKVYDITDRKNYCSNQCYKAGKFVKDQLLTSPLWLRDKEEVPHFKLLAVNSSGSGAGEEIIFTKKSELKKGINEPNRHDQILSVADYPIESLSQIPKKVDNLEQEKNVEHKLRHSQESHLITSQGSTLNVEDAASKKAMTPCLASTIESCLDATVSTDTGSVSNTKNNTAKDHRCPVSIGKHTSEQAETTFRDVSAKLSDAHQRGKKQNKIYKKDESTFASPVTTSVIHIERCVSEWFTIHTMCFLFGEDKVKEMVCEKGECIKEYYTVGHSSWSSKIQERYEAICKKLNIMELEENHLEAENRELKPLPNYKVLKEEGIKMEIKINAFYQGRTNYEIPENNFVEEKDVGDTPSCVLPLVDIHAQNSLRRRMVLDNLNRVLPDLLRTFGSSSQDVSTDVRHLVGTFSLSPHNITFKPTEWSLLGLIIIKMLSIKDTSLKILLDNDQGMKYQTMMLLAFQQDSGYLEKLMVWLTDLDNLMKHC